jgi:hypothetical protein
MAPWKNLDKTFIFLTKFLPAVPLEQNYTKQNQEISSTQLLKNAGFSDNGDYSKCLSKILKDHSRFFKEFKGSRNSRLIHLTAEGVSYRNVLSNAKKELSKND